MVLADLISGILIGWTLRWKRDKGILDKMKAELKNLKKLLNHLKHG